MNIETLLINQGFLIADLLKKSSAFSCATQPPKIIIDEQTKAGNELYILLHDFVKFQELMIKIYNAWGQHLNEYIIENMNSYNQNMIIYNKQQQQQQEAQQKFLLLQAEYDAQNLHSSIGALKISPSIDDVTKSFNKAGLGKFGIKPKYIYKRKK